MDKNDHVDVAEPEVKFGADNLVTNARVYRSHKAIINAASRYDNVDDAIAALKSGWEVLEIQVSDGAGFTPATELGFGSDNAAQIAEKILGLQPSVGTVRANFSKMGQV